MKPFWDDVVSVWDICADRPQIEQDRFHFQLVNFFFLHESLIWHVVMRREEGLYEFPEIEKLAKEYLMWAEGLPDDEGSERLDFSHVDLLHDLPRSAAEAAQGMEGVFRALKEDPDSIPAILAFIWHAEHAEDYSEVYAVGRELLTGRIGRLTLARYASEAFDENDPFDVESIEDAVEITPSREEKALFLGLLTYAKFGEERVSAVRDIFESFPNTQVGEAAGIEAIQLALEWQGTGKALEAIRRLQGKGHQGSKILDSGLVLVGESLLGEDDLDRAEAVFLEVAEEHSQWSRAVSDAMFWVSQIHDRRGERQERIGWLEAAVSKQPCNPDAAWTLAGILEDDGRWAEAARTLRLYVVEDVLCDNAGFGEGLALEVRRARLEATAGNGEVALQTLVKHIRHPNPLDLGAGETIQEVLYHLYVDANQVQDLRVILRQLEVARLKERKEAPEGKGVNASVHREQPDLGPIREMLCVYELFERGDVAELLSVCRDPKGYPERMYWASRPDWTRREAVENLARIGADAVEPLREAAADPGPGLIWFLDALGWISGPESLRALEKLIEQGPPPKGWSEPGTALPSGYRPLSWLVKMGEALARKGSAGKSLLDRLSHDLESPMHESAQEWLEMLQAGWSPPRPRPPVRPGSMPRRLSIRE